MRRIQVPIMLPDLAVQAEAINQVRAELDIGIEYKPVLLSDLKIRTKERQLITLVPNAVQTAYLDLLHEKCPSFDWRNGVYSLRGMREDILKFRQPGFSTLILAIFFLDTINTPHTETVVYAHDGEGTEKLFQIVHRFYDNLPPDKKRPAKYEGKSELVFDGIDSGLYVGVVGGKRLGRGSTPNNVHLSERAWNDKFEDLETGLFPSVPKTGNIIRETTANGYNQYYTERQRIYSGESLFNARFFCWLDHQEYESDVPEAFTLTEDEEKLKNRYPKFNERKFQWRREQVSALKGVSTFQQEYPIIEEEAFVSSGMAVFDVEAVADYLAQVNSPSNKPLKNLKFPSDFAPLREVFTNGQLELWVPPRERSLYVISADIAEGRNPGHGDWSDADIIESDTWEQVGHLHIQCNPTHFGELLCMLGMMYNEALIVPENNSRGYECTLAIQRFGYREQTAVQGLHGLFFYNPRLLGASKVSAMETKGRQAGWPTYSKTRDFAIGKCQAAIADRQFVLHSKITAQQLKTFVVKEGGRKEHEKGANDDAVISLCIGAAVLALKYDKVGTGGRGRTSAAIVPAEPMVTGRLGRRA